MYMSYWRLLAAVGVVTGAALLSGCSTLPFGEQASLSTGAYAPVVSPQTPLDADLMALPPAAASTVVAVYDFPDLTGQFKDEDNYQSLSKAVSQGGAPMLISTKPQGDTTRARTLAMLKIAVPSTNKRPLAATNAQ